MVADGITNALAANALTLWLAYGCWRIKRNERDVIGILHAIAPLIVIAGLAYIART
jgi:hypothetical protein